MGEPVRDSKVFAARAATITSKGSATAAGEQRQREGKGLNPLVDPKSNGVIRRSISWLEPQPDERFFLLRGTAMLEETRLDTTGSMGDNIEIAMRALPKTYKLLTEGSNPLLGRYDLQMITSIFGDTVDRYILCRSHAEMGEKVVDQMSMMVPEGNGGDSDEDPQYGLFAAAYLTSATIKQLGLKSYDFTITDASAHDLITTDDLKRVFGNEVFEKCAENGFDIDPRNLPSNKEIVTDLLKTTHAFILIVGEHQSTIGYWSKIFGQERIVVIPSAMLLPEVKAAIIGLTEGVLTLDSVVTFLMEEAGIDQVDAVRIRNAVAGIPIGAQTMLENFDKIPLRGDVFEKKGDLWPIVRKADLSDTGDDKSIWK